MIGLPTPSAAGLFGFHAAELLRRQGGPKKKQLRFDSQTRSRRLRLGMFAPAVDQQVPPLSIESGEGIRIGKAVSRVTEGHLDGGFVGDARHLSCATTYSTDSYAML